MSDFLRRLAELARPYKLRLLLGIVCGVLSGVLEPVLILTVVFVWKVVFRQAQTPQGVEFKVPKLLRPAMDHLQSWILSAGGPSSKTMLALVVAAIPAIMLLRGIVGYLHAYLMNWVSFRAVNDLRMTLSEPLVNLPRSFFSR